MRVFFGPGYRSDVCRHALFRLDHMHPISRRKDRSLPFARIFCSRTGPLVGLFFCLVGCTSIRGMQDHVAATDLNKGVCPSLTELTDFNSKTGKDRREYRDAVILDCIQAINTKYDDFKANLQKDGVSANLATDILSLGLTTGAALTKGQTAKELAAAGAFVIGSGTAINKDVFYQQTLPAIESSMDAKRDTILKGIIDSEKSDADATRYTLASAGLDLDAYESAGNIYAAISELTKTANLAAQTAKSELKQSQAAPYVVQVLPADVFARGKKLTDYVWALSDNAANRMKLDAIAVKLGAIPDPKDFYTEQVHIVDKITERLGVGDPKAQVDALEKDLVDLLK